MGCGHAAGTGVAGVFLGSGPGGAAANRSWRAVMAVDRLSDIGGSGEPVVGLRSASRMS